MHFMLIKSQHSGVMSVINAEVMVMLFYVSISTRINSCLVLKIQPSRFVFCPNRIEVKFYALRHGLPMGKQNQGRN